MKLITEKEYRDFVEQREKITDLILAKTVQLALIEDGRPPKGDIVDYDFAEENGKIFVHSDYETYHLPLEFLFDELYLEKYRLIWEEEKRKKKKKKR